MEKTTRYSKKREAILDLLRSTDSHPSADWVYQTLRPVYPDLSLGTVYRNLTRFKEEGLVVSVGTVNGQERFDARVYPHTHFVCRRCGAVLDLPGIKPEEELDLERISRENGVTIEHHELIFYGACPDCSPQKINKKLTKKTF